MISPQSCYTMNARAAKSRGKETYRLPDPAEGPSILVLDCRIDPGELARLIRLTFGDRVRAITFALTGEGEPLP